MKKLNLDFIFFFFIKIKDSNFKALIFLNMLTVQRLIFSYCAGICMAKHFTKIHQTTFVTASTDMF